MNEEGFLHWESVSKVTVDSTDWNCLPPSRNPSQQFNTSDPLILSLLHTFDLEFPKQYTNVDEANTKFFFV